jgi:hypothetical protein
VWQPKLTSTMRASLNAVIFWVGSKVARPSRQISKVETSMRVERASYLDVLESGEL